MSNNPQHPDVGDLIIDASNLRVRDMTPEEIRAATKLRAGGISAIQRIIQLDPKFIEAAGISPLEISRATSLLDEHAYAHELLAPSEKLAELVRETKIDRGHQLANLLTEIAAQVRRRAERNLLDSEVLAALEEVLEYQYGPAYRAQLTKAKKAEQQAREAASPSE